VSRATPITVAVRRKGSLHDHRPSDGVAGAEDAARGELAEDDDRRGGGMVAFVETTTPQDGHADGLEEGRRRGDAGGIVAIGLAGGGRVGLRDRQAHRGESQRHSR
jgi:hypothetical protein